MEYSHDWQRPNRSDAHLSAEEEARMEAETRNHFEDLAPKRHSKPQRSEYSSSYLDKNTTSDAIPEYAEFRRLEGHEEKLEYSSGQVEEEFVETDYYKDLNSVGKQHHTTGTGFIKVENMNGNGYHMKEAGQACHSTSCLDGACHGNPATNDWIPALSDKADFVSAKPSRSDI